MVEVSEKLESRRYITKGERGHWLLARDLDTVTLAKLQSDLGLSVEPADIATLRRTAWGARYAEIVEKLRQSESGITDVSLKDLLRPGDEAEVIEFPDTSEDGEEDDGEEVTDRKTRLLALLGLTTLGSS